MKITYSNTINFEKNSKEHIDCMFTDNQNVKLTAFDIVKIINNLKCYQKFNQKKFTYKDEDGELEAPNKENPKTWVEASQSWETL